MIFLDQIWFLVKIINLNKLLSVSKEKGVNKNDIRKTKKKEIKPGYDMYNYIAFSQFLIMIYTILFFTLIERDYSNRAPENYTLQQFSGSTVLVVFAMILVIWVDRHIYLTDKFIIVKKKSKSEDVQEFEEKDYSQARDFIFDIEKEQEKMMTDAMKIVLSHNLQKVIDYSMRSALNNSSNSLLFDHNFINDLKEENIILQDDEKDVTYRRYPVVLKIILQWILIVVVHFGLFWYLPSRTNQQIQNHYYWDSQKVNAHKCNEFDRNPHLVIYYLLFVFYFTVSALQISYGYPELVSGNFLMKKSTKYNGFGYTIFTYIPFLLEFKVITEWLETKTALGLMQWMKFQIIYGDLFRAKCDSIISVSRFVK